MMIGFRNKKFMDFTFFNVVSIDRLMPARKRRSALESSGTVDAYESPPRYEPILSVTPENLENVGLGPCKFRQFLASDQFCPQICRLINTVDFLLDLLPIVQSCPFYTAEEIASYESGLQILKSLEPDPRSRTFSSVAYVKEFAAVWADHFDRIFRHLDIQQYQDVFATSRTTASSILHTTHQDAIDGSRTPSSVFSIWDELQAVRKRLATSLSVLLHSPRVRSTITLSEKVIETRGTAVKFLKACSHCPHEKITTLQTCFQSMLESTLDLKTVLVLMDLGPLVERLINDVQNTPLLSDVAREGILERLKLNVVQTTPFLEAFAGLRDGLRAEKDLGVIQTGLETFVDNYRGDLQIDCILFDLFFKVRGLQLSGAKIGVLGEMNLAGPNLSRVNTKLVHFIAAFHAVAGTIATVDTIRVSLGARSADLREAVRDVDEQAAAAFTNLASLAQAVDDIRRDLQGLEDTIVVVERLNQILDEKLPNSTIRPIQLISTFFKWPDLAVAFVRDERPKVPAFSALVTKFRDLLVQKRFGADDPKITNVLGQIRRLGVRRVVEHVLRGPPFATESRVFEALEAVVRMSCTKKETFAEAVGALEALHILHFYFMARDLAGLQRYSDSILGVYFRAHCDFLLDSDVENARAKWTAKAQDLAHGEADSLLGTIRQGFYDLVHEIERAPRQDDLVELFAWFLRCSIEVPEFDQIERAIKLATKFSLGSTAATLKEYLARRRSNADVDPAVRFFNAVFQTEFPEFASNSQLALLPFFGKAASCCSEQGDIAFDGDPADDLDAFRRSLVVTPQMSFQLVAQEICELGDTALSAAFQVIFRGGFSRATLTECFRLCIRSEHFAVVWDSVLRLTNFLIFVQTRDALFDDFSMLRQLNLKFIDSFGNGCRFLATVMPIPDDLLKPLLKSAQHLRTLVNEVSLIEPIRPELFEQIFLAYSTIRIAADGLNWNAELANVSRLLEGSTLFDTFHRHIAPSLEALEIPPKFGEFVEDVQPHPNSARILDSLDLVFLLITLTKQADAFFKFSFSDSQALELRVVPYPLRLVQQPVEVDPLSMPYSILNRRFLAFNRSQLRETANELIREPIPELAIPVPDDLLPNETQQNLLDLLVEMQGEHEALGNVAGEKGWLAAEIAELERQCARYEKEIAGSLIWIRNVCERFMAEQRELTEDFQRREREVRAETRRLKRAEMELMSRTAGVEKEIAFKQRQRMGILQADRGLRAANKELAKDAGDIEKMLAEEAAPLVQVDVMPPALPEEERHLVMPEIAVEDAPEEVIRQPQRRPGFVPDSLKKFTRPWMMLPVEAKEMIERQTASWEVSRRASARQVGATALEVDAGPINDRLLQKVRAEIEDKKRRAQKGSQILAEILAQIETGI
jgi:hypothetical protein